jgi:hypothetical protein
VRVKGNLCVWGEGFGLGCQLKSVTCEVTGTSYSFEDISYYEQFLLQQLISLTKRFFFSFGVTAPIGPGPPHSRDF